MPNFNVPVRGKFIINFTQAETFSLFFGQIELTIGHLKTQQEANLSTSQFSTFTIALWVLKVLDLGVQRNLQFLWPSLSSTRSIVVLPFAMDAWTCSDNWPGDGNLRHKFPRKPRMNQFSRSNLSSRGDEFTRNVLTTLVNCHVGNNNVGKLSVGC